MRRSAPNRYPDTMTHPAPEADVQATIAQLWIHPVKSCAAVSVQEAQLTPTGLAWDRAWMVVDAEGEFVTQRELPRMALVQPKLKHSEMVLRAPGMLALHIALDAREEGGFWRFSVADNGPGFDPDKSGELFKPFSRLDERQAGIGDAF